MLPRPSINPILITTLVLERKIWCWNTRPTSLTIILPVKGRERHMGSTHYVLAEGFTQCAISLPVDIHGDDVLG